MLVFWAPERQHLKNINSQQQSVSARRGLLCVVRLVNLRHVALRGGKHAAA